MKKNLFCLLLIFSISSAFATTKYQVLDLGTLHTEASRATSINDKGEICGTYKKGNDSFLFVWKPDSGINFTGIPITLSFNPLINNSGNVVGVNGVWQKQPYHLFLVNDKNEIKNVAVESSTAIWLEAFNDLNQIVFSKDDSIFLFENGETRNFGKFFSRLGTTLNNQGELFGTATSANGNTIARYHNIKTRRTYDVGEKGYVMGMGINNIGLGIIYYSFGNQFFGLLWTPEKGVIKTFPLEQSENPKKINDIGQIIVGTCSILDEDLKSININKILNLELDWNTPFEKISEIIDLNNHGLMVGTGIVKGKGQAVLLVPILE